MEEFLYELRIPKERVPVLIGKDGEVKRRIEEDTHSRMEIDSKEGDVFLRGSEAIPLFTAREIVMAIGRGFSPGNALLLLKTDYIFEIINLRDYSGKSKNTMERLKGRVIGKDGKARRTIEDLSEAAITVFGKTIGIIADAEGASMARYAIESLLQGSTHANVYKWLETKRRQLKRAELLTESFSKSI